MLPGSSVCISFSPRNDCHYAAVIPSHLSLDQWVLCTATFFSLNKDSDVLSREVLAPLKAHC